MKWWELGKIAVLEDGSCLAVANFWVRSASHGKIKSASNIDMSVPVGASSAHQSIGCVGRVLTGLAGNFRE